MSKLQRVEKWETFCGSLGSTRPHTFESNKALAGVFRRVGQVAQKS